MTHSIHEIQTVLAGLGIYKGKIDGDYGKLTTAAVRAFQRINRLEPDGKAGLRTQAAMFPTLPTPVDRPISSVEPKPAQLQWPTQSGCTAFYGEPGGKLCTAGKVTLPFRFRIAWNLNQRVASFQCHSLVAAPMTAIFAEAAAHYGEDEYRRLGLDLFGGCYNLRKMRGGSAWSMHSWGIAVDLDPARNQLKWGRDLAEFAKPAYEPFWRIVEAHGAVSLGRARNFDWMHFQFARL